MNFPHRIDHPAAKQARAGQENVQGFLPQASIDARYASRDPRVLRPHPRSDHDTWHQPFRLPDVGPRGVLLQEAVAAAVRDDQVSDPVTSVALSGRRPDWVGSAAGKCSARGNCRGGCVKWAARRGRFRRIRTGNAGYCSISMTWLQVKKIGDYILKLANTTCCVKSINI